MLLVYSENPEVILVVIDSSVSPLMIELEPWEIDSIVDHFYQYRMCHVIKIQQMIMEVVEVGYDEQVTRMIQ